MRILWMSACVMLLFGAVRFAAQTTVLPPGDASGSDWPQWAGPSANYTSPEKGLLREWPDGGPQVLWRARIGQGWSSPSIAGDEIYVVSTEWSTKWEQGEKETTVCLDAKTGSNLWSHVYDTGKHYQSANINIGWYWGGPRATPTVTEKYVYSLGLLGHITCLDRKTHQPVWEQDLEKTYWPGPYPEWKGVNFSPLVADGVVLIPFAAVGTNCFSALDAETGKVKWVYPAGLDLTGIKGCNPGGTPGVVTFGSDHCMIQEDSARIGAGHRIFSIFRALRLSDGKPIWDTMLNFESKPDGGTYRLDRQLLLSAGPVFSVDVDFKTAPFPSKVVWASGAMGGTYHGYVCTADAVYGFNGIGDAMDLTKWNHGLICTERATGKKMWEQKGFKSGVSVIAADGLLFVRSFQSLYLVEDSLKGYVQKGKVEKLHDVTNARGTDGGWVMPVLSRGKLYVRTPSELICYKVSKD